MGFGLAAILVTVMIAFESYLYISDSTVAEECRSSLITKGKYRKGVTYFDMEEGVGQ